MTGSTYAWAAIVGILIIFAYICITRNRPHKTDQTVTSYQARLLQIDRDIAETTEYKNHCSNNKRLLKICDYRLIALKAEKSALQESQNDKNQFWQSYTKNADNIFKTFASDNVDEYLLELNSSDNANDWLGGINTVKTAFKNQTNETQELVRAIELVQLDMREKKRLIKIAHNFQNCGHEMEAAISILEDENEFLKKQIQALLQQELQSD